MTLPPALTLSARLFELSKDTLPNTFQKDSEEGLSAELKDFFSLLQEAIETHQSRSKIKKLFDEDQTDSPFIKYFFTAIFASDFLQKNILKDPSILIELSCIDHTKVVDNAHLTTTFEKCVLQYGLNIQHEDAFNRALRLLRNHIQSIIIWLDSNRLFHLHQTTRSLSNLASFCIQKSVDFHTSKLELRYGVPSHEGKPQPFFVVGMGKLGAWELNLSSDVDLIFAFAQSGETSPIDASTTSTKTISNQVFFNKLGQKIIQTLDTTTVDGFVFRVDMRLRPFGQSGALTHNFLSLEDYYQTQGREWERYAMVKARVVAFTRCDDLACHTQTFHYKTQLETLLTQFTYRKFIDFSVINALRGLKKMIIQDITRRGLGDNIKLGQGGIREVEFIAQAFQLIRGGRDIALQDNRVDVILTLLEKLGYLPASKASKLLEAYTFLRNTEHALQAYKDEQTQTLPTAEQQRTRLAFVMGFTHWEAFSKQLDAYRQVVSDEFKVVIAPVEEPSHSCALDGAWEHVWQGSLDSEAALDILQKNKHEDPAETLKILNELHDSAVVESLQGEARARLDIFMPRLLAQISNTATPTLTLLRIIKLVKSVIRRSAYLLLLIENPSALVQLVKLSEASPQIADTLSLHPALLDELLDSRTLYQVPEKAALSAELRASLLRIEPGDLEAQMEVFRYFKNAHGLRVAACEVAGTLPLMKVSDYLTNLAETIVSSVLHLSWEELVAKHGYPDGENRSSPNFIVVGYGKLGGLEMSHGSDLDLVFIHNAGAHGSTDGEKSIDNQRFYIRLGQKIIHMMNTRTAGGQLYEVDMRLRPSGNSGLLVSTLPAFDKYQRNTAWTWEHQALVRARVVAGDSALEAAFNEIRKNVLSQPRHTKKLQQDVLEMREKMRSHLGSSNKASSEETFHIKHDAGGIVDIEFMVQYAVLAWAHAHPALQTYTDNIRILKSLQAASLFSAQQAAELIDAYKALRATGHRLALQSNSNVIDATLLKSEQEKVTKHWQALFGGR